MTENNNLYELLPVLRELHNISGFRISVHDIDFNEITAYPTAQSPFCRMIKEGDKTCLSCFQNDKMAFERVKQTGKVYLYQCSFGLYEAVAPLYSFGQPSGYLMMGQTIDTMSSSREFVFKNASPFFEDKERLMETVQKIHIRAKENILSCISIMGICAEYITLTNRLNSTKKDIAVECRRYIDGHFKEKITIDFLCGSFFCSRATLINAFKKRYSITINEYITTVRITKAKELLEKTDLHIADIAEECGFSDQNYFCKVFLKSEGKTPSAYRR